MSAPTLTELLDELQSKGVPLTDEQYNYLRELDLEKDEHIDDLMVLQSKGLVAKQQPERVERENPDAFQIPYPNCEPKQIPGSNVWVHTKWGDPQTIIRFEVRSDTSELITAELLSDLLTWVEYMPDELQDRVEKALEGRTPAT